MYWSTSDLRVRLASGETGLSPPVKYFYWPFQGGTSFVDHLCYLYLVIAMLKPLCSLLPCGHQTGKGWPLGPCLWYLLWFCYFPIWYPGTRVILDCIDYWSFCLSYFENSTCDPLLHIINHLKFIVSIQMENPVIIQGVNSTCSNLTYHYQWDIWLHLCVRTVPHDANTSCRTGQWITNERHCGTCPSASSDLHALTHQSASYQWLTGGGAYYHRIL